MGITDPKIMTGDVMHARLLPRHNAFKYGIYYIALPLSKLAHASIARERFSPVAFYTKDHGPCDGSSLLVWARDILSAYGLHEADGEITLICMPRIMGYVFNPVSFWLCYDTNENIRAVICEVHNTFGERHSYLCARDDHEPITGKDKLIAQKMFHVSPFLQRQGTYEFTFDVSKKRFGAWIDFYDEDRKKVLVTSLAGSLETLSKENLSRAFWRYPLVTLKAVFLIHWQALKIMFKGIQYVRKPPQKQENLSGTHNITKV